MYLSGFLCTSCVPPSQRRLEESGALEHATVERDANKRSTWRRAASLRTSRGLLTESLDLPDPATPWHGTAAVRAAADDGGGPAPGPARGLGLRVSSDPAGRLLPAGDEAAAGGRKVNGAVAGAGSRDRVGSPLAAALALLRLPRAGSASAPQVGHLACAGAANCAALHWSSCG